jgi:hypothetical protein
LVESEYDRGMVLAAVRRATAAIADKIKCFMGNLRFPR